jgi:hypothetical protein
MFNSGFIFPLVDAEIDVLTKGFDAYVSSNQEEFRRKRILFDGTVLSWEYICLFNKGIVSVPLKDITHVKEGACYKPFPN